MAIAALCAPLHARADEPKNAPPAAASAANTWTMPARSASDLRLATVDPSYGYGPAGAAPNAVVPGAGNPTSPAHGAALAPALDDTGQEEIEPAEPQPPFFDLAAGTYAPLSIGGDATVELPGRVLLQLGFGAMPPGYSALVTKLVTAASGGDASLGALVDASVERALSLRVSAGWRPFPSEGFEVWLGYTSTWLAGSIAPADIASFASEPTASLITSTLQSDVELGSQLHNIHVALGWRFVAWDHLVIRASLGYTQTLGARSSLRIAGHPDLAAQAAAVVEPVLEDAFKRYVKLPLIGLSAGYRF